MIKINVLELMRETALLTVPETAKLTGIDERTIRRWRSNGECPVWFVRFCHVINGDLGELPGERGKMWAGWKIFHNGDLARIDGGGYPPHYFDPKYLGGLYFYFQKLDRGAAKLQRQIEVQENFIKELQAVIRRLNPDGGQVVPLVSGTGWPRPAVQLVQDQRPR
jgi:hypothetical protein